MGPQPDDQGTNPDLFLLRRKLAALCYDDAVDEHSAVLVQHLLDDLIRVTEGYRQQKTQLAKSHQELDDAHAQVGPLKFLRLAGAF